MTVAIQSAAAISAPTYMYATRDDYGLTGSIVALPLYAPTAIGALICGTTRQKSVVTTA